MAHGASQVLYLDSTNEYIEEAGAMNHFHILKDGTVIIPEFTDTILKSITSQSIIELAPLLGCDVRQEQVKLDDFIAGVESGEIIEAGGFGTAAVVSPVGSYIFEDGRVSPLVTARWVNMSVASIESSPKSRKGTDKAHKAGFAKCPGWRRHKPITNY